MPRWAKVVLWVVVFALCGAAGAWVASRTDPFPPGVDDPGARSSPSPTTTPSPVPEVLWVGSFTATTEHLLHVGGTCTSDWRGEFRLRLEPDGSLGGEVAIAILDPGSAGCDFSQAQTQTTTVDLAVGGSWERRGSRLSLSPRFREQSVEPPASIDVGGFRATIEAVRPVIGPVFDAPFDELGDRQVVRVPDGNQGTYVATYDFLASCRRGCG